MSVGVSAGQTKSGHGCVLVVDDEEHIREIIAATLSPLAGKVLVAGSAEEALEILRDENVDVVVSDIHMPGMTGLEFLRQVKLEQPSVLFLMVTAHGSLDTVVQALRHGASDFLTKPFENSELREIVKRLLSSPTPPSQVASYAFETGSVGKASVKALGESPVFKACLEKMHKASQSDSTVLLLGESGTGKEVGARLLHDLSPRRGSPFIPVNCGAIPENLIESELFGHEKGAFTGASVSKPGRFVLAEGGTVFLDEIGELPLSMQVKLLRVLQERVVDPVGGRGSVRVDFRLVAATNRNLREEVRQGRFREDLYFRLNIISIEMPPLRERGNDILILTRYFLDHFNRRYGTLYHLTSAQERPLLDYSWPGNVRELANVVERAVVLAAGPELFFQLEGAVAEDAPKAPDIPHTSQASHAIKGRKQDVEREEILKALETSRWNKTHAAESLGISRRGLLYKIKEYGIR